MSAYEKLKATERGRSRLDRPSNYELLKAKEQAIKQNTTSTADSEGKNRIQKYRDAVTAERRRASIESTAQETKLRVEQNSKPRAKVSGMKLDPATAAAKNAADAEIAERKASKTAPPVAQLGEDEKHAIAFEFGKQYGHEFNLSNEFNGQNFVNAFQTSFQEGRVQWTVADMLRVCRWLQDNGYFQRPSGTRLRGEAPAKEYPAPPDPSAEPEDAPVQKVLVRNLTHVEDPQERKRLRNVNLDDLQKQVRSELRGKK